MTRMSALLAALLVVAACDDGTGPATATSVSLTFASDAPAGAAPAPGAAAAPARAPISDGTNTLEITSVRIVLRQVELKSAEVSDCNADPAACESFRSDPVLVDVPVDGSTSTDVSIDIPAGTYDQVEFDIHEVTASDGAFLTQNPTMENKSIAVEGTYNGSPFTFETNMSQEQKFTLVPSLVVTDGGMATNVTIRFDVSTWFRDQQGDLFDPATASTGESNESVAEENIQNSIKAFQDLDRDGDETDEI